MDKPFVSIAFDGAEAADAPLEREPPPYFTDVNLDQVVDAITDGRDDYDLKPLFYTRLTSRDAVAYRHEVLRDLEEEALRAHVTEFARRMREMRVRLGRAKRSRHRHEQHAWLLEAADAYCDAVGGLADGLAAADLRSRGLLGLRERLGDYARSEAFTALATETAHVKADVAAVRYCVNIRGGRVTVSRYEDEPDYSAEIEQTFERFKRGAAKDYRVRLGHSLDLNHVEAHILDLVARLHPETFAALQAYCERRRDFVDESLARFDREVQFYVAWLEYLARFSDAELPLCYPDVSERSEEIRACDTFDLALADKLVRDGSPVVRNDVELTDPERVIVVSGPNQGGKTTFARTVGQLHHLAGLGLHVPGRDARLQLCDEIFTHFEREEDSTELSGKLEDDLLRIHAILERATSRSLVVMNETLTSTTLRDARLIGSAVIERLVELDVLCVYVTFVDELASLGEATVSMMSTVMPDDPATRTYRIERRPADGLAYAAAIAAKHGLGYERLTERLAA